MTPEQIYELILSFLPSITAVISVIVSCVNMARRFNTLRTEIKDTTDLKRVEAQVKRVLMENAELKRETRDLYKAIKLKVDKIDTGVTKNEDKKV